MTVHPALTFETDGTFGGLLSAYAEAYRRGALPAEVRLAGEPASGALFGETVRVDADTALAERVERGVKRIKPGLVGRLHRAFLSERPGMEVAVLRLIDAARERGAGAAADWTFDPAREVSRWSGRVGREAHRMEAFVRFERVEVEGAERFVAHARPEYHVLPLLTAHFAGRYPTLAWRIVDVRRGLALVHTPEPDRAPAAPPTRIVPASALPEGGAAPEEESYQAMWKAYFRAVTIPERRNLKLHLRHVPRRYWPYLTEKQAE
ncbi:TIGR03915 family putative DNA repair protein [Rubrivirga sp. S365]|uniref:TIGR03915 family putative DNA repair protein n=1 Tax=Rubrivirga litoralis TaxID=3075598 RepID=A0ABU3BM62_9BACT|nr:MULTISPECIES: TIGR03915 family putative DNA repair protein [unclassified Rubrivirga]MDT0630320.1 TIGR03915 family putative DNA repair protein [Rubrivirga sp. F394]MDT7855832.1 TIGR03915 family putative DNA repair protein [Rubrivirga sp. S365]